MPRTRSLADASRGDIRDRLLAAATAVFARRGYRAATMREIAQEAQANLASAHYHFGSKRDLYLEVARGQFEEVDRRLSRGRTARSPEDALAARVRTLLELLLDPDLPHARIILRELSDPSEALPVIVRRFVAPLVEEMTQLVKRIEPGLCAGDADRCVRSTVGQAFFYFSHMPALLLMMGRPRYPKDFVRATAEHITRFSLAGIAAVAEASARPARDARSSAGGRA